MSFVSDPQVILASPDAEFRQKIGRVLETMRWPYIEAVGGADALNRLESLAGIETVVLDHWLPDLQVEDFDISLRAHRDKLDVLLVNFDADENCRTNRSLVHSRTKELTWQLGRTTASVQEELLPGSAGASQISGLVVNEQDVFNSVSTPLPGLIGTHVALRELSRLVRLVAARKTSVLITGETGTGKEVVAKAVHQLSPRSASSFVTVNCAAIPETLLESELFGYARGAFTGATQSKLGRIQAADGGTLFLDEIGELPSSLQAKLLRFLQEGEVQRLGSNETTKVDVRVISATHANLAPPQKTGHFRQDLYYRLAVFPVQIPPLRQRSEDILLLSQYFLTDICSRDGVREKHLGADLSAKLLQHEWPGNVRELQHVIERAFILSQDERVLTLKHLPMFHPQKILNFN